MLRVRKRHSIKADREREVADRLLAALEIEATFTRYGDPKESEPDVLYRKADGKIFGSEVSTAYYEDSDAKDGAEIATGEKPLGAGEIRVRSGGDLG